MVYPVGWEGLGLLAVMEPHLRRLFFLLLPLLAGFSLRAGEGAGVRWFPARAELHRNGMLILLLDESQVALAGQLRATRAFLRQVSSGERVPLDPLELLHVEDLEGHALAYRPGRTLAPRSHYRFEAEGVELPERRVYRTLAGRAPRIRSVPPRFRSLPDHELRFTCPQLRRAGWVQVEVERSTGVGEEDPDWDLQDAVWERLGSYVLHPVWRQGPEPFVDLARALGIPGSPFRVRFTLIGRDGFVGRPSGWRILPGVVGTPG